MQKLIKEYDNKLMMNEDDISQRISTILKRPIR